MNVSQECPRECLRNRGCPREWCQKSVSRAPPECQKGVPNPLGTLSGHSLDTPETTPLGHSLEHPPSRGGHLFGIFLWYRGGLSLLFGIEIFFLASRFCTLLFGIEIAFFPGSARALFLGPRHPVHWRSKRSQGRKRGSKISIPKEDISIPTKRVTRHNVEGQKAKLTMAYGIFKTAPKSAHFDSVNI